MIDNLVIGTRASKLALWQTNYVLSAIKHKFPQVNIITKELTTKGDKNINQPLPQIGGKGLFTAELEQALRENEIDIAVHSLKDLPTEMESDLCLGAICKRASVHDILISKSKLGFWQLAQGALIGTSSPRRLSQIKRLRPDLNFESIRGNVDSRIAKVNDVNLNFDATILAQAGVSRLGLDAQVNYIFSFDEMLPAPGQGALAVQCATKRMEVIEILSAIECKATRAEVTCERAFLQTLAAGCTTPIGALAVLEAGKLKFKARCLSNDGSKCIEVQGEDVQSNAFKLGERLAAEARTKGFEKI